MSIKELIMLKCNPLPVTHTRTNITFPEMIQWNTYPKMDKRTAGFIISTVDLPQPLPQHSFKFPVGCFQTAPYTLFPCYSYGFDHKQ